MKIRNWTFQQEEFEEELNLAKEVFLSDMVKEGLITNETAEAMCQYAIQVISKEPCKFGNWLKEKIFTRNESNDTNYFVTVKVFVCKTKAKEEEKINESGTTEK